MSQNNDSAKKAKQTFLGAHKLPIAALASTLLCALAFSNVHLYLLVFIGLTPLLLTIADAKDYSAKQIIRFSWIAGFIFSLAVLLCILQPASTNWAALQGPSAKYITFFAWFLSSAVFACGFLIVGFMVNRFKHRSNLLPWILVIAWPFGELARSYLFALYSFGPSGSIGPHWNVGSLGLAVAASPLAYLSRFIGLFGLTAVAVLCNVTLLRLFQKKWKTAGLIIVPLVVLNILAYKLYQPSGESIPVSAVHLQQDDTMQNWPTVQLPTKNPNLLALPEYSLFTQNKQYQNIIANDIGQKTTIITTVEGPTSPHTNTLTYLSGEKHLISQQDKTFLMPSGETMPYVYGWLLKLLKMDPLVDSFNHSQQVKKGIVPERPVTNNGVTIGGLACSGVINFSEYRRLTKEGAEVLVNSASLSLLTGSSLYHVQERYLTRFHAIANARPFVQSSRSGESYILDSNGKILQFKTGASGVLSQTVTPVHRRTIYSLF